MSHSLINYPSDTNPVTQLVMPEGDLNRSAAALNASLEAVTDTRVPYVGADGTSISATTAHYRLRISGLPGRQRSERVGLDQQRDANALCWHDCNIWPTNGTVSLGDGQYSSTLRTWAPMATTTELPGAVSKGDVITNTDANTNQTIVSYAVQDLGPVGRDTELQLSGL